MQIQFIFVSPLRRDLPERRGGTSCHVESMPRRALIERLKTGVRLFSVPHLESL
jgi:hypothetical protein